MDFFRRFSSYIYKVNYAHLLVLGLVAKALISDVSYASFLITIPVLGFEAYKLYIRSQTPDAIQVDTELRKELDNIKSKLNAQTFEKSVKPPVPRYF